MRKYLLPIALVVLIAACKDEEETPVINPMVGTWNLEEVEILNSPYEGLIVNPFLFTGNFSERIIAYENNRFDYRIERNDGSIVYLPGDWTFESDTLILNYDQPDFSDELYNVNDSVLSIQYLLPLPDPEDSTATINAVSEWIYAKIR